MKPHHDYIKVWVAKLDTRSFEFSAYDATEEGAVFALKQGLANHALRFNLTDDDWYFEGDIICDQFTLGHAYQYGRDAPIYEP
jgi:hypothetical protein